MMYRSWFTAAIEDDLGSIQQMQPKMVGKTDKAGRTALMMAIMRGARQVAEYLAQFEAGVTTAEGHSALMFAVAHRNHRLVQLLLPKEAGIQARNGQTALQLAAIQGDFPTIYDELVPKEAKMRTKEGVSALQFSILQKNEELFFKLAPLELDLLDGKKMTPLMYAARAGRLNYLEYIIKHAKHQVGARDADGKTALRHAFEALEFDEKLEEGQRDDYVNQLQGIIQILLKQEVNLTASDEMTSLMFFAQNGALDLVKQLSVQYKMQDS